jgi:nitric oxide reductase NorD protein
MTGTDGTHRFGLLASHLAGTAIRVATAQPGRPACTDGTTIFVSPDVPHDQQRREVIVQSALLAAGSLDRSIIRALRARPALARRYLTVEGYRALNDLGTRAPIAADLCSGATPESSGSADSLAMARSRRKLPEPPDWFGQITPAPLLRGGGTSTVGDSPVGTDATDEEEDDDGPTDQSRILKLFEAPAFSSRALAEFLRKLLGSSRSYGDNAAGVEADFGPALRGRGTGAGAHPSPTRIRFTGDGAVGVAGALFPEWDVHSGRYRPEWTRVIDFPLEVRADAGATEVVADDVLRRRLARVGLGFRVFRARPDGDELDTEALIDLFVDMRSGHSPPGDVYVERRRSGRDLGVLILLDASGSATDVDRAGLAVHERQRQAAATLTATLEGLGDRVALCGFRSHGRHAVHLPVIKSFEHRFGVRERTRLAQLQPAGYTRLGAGIRGAAEILKARAGTPHRLLVVISDGHAYDHGYEGTYAEADVARALAELTSDGVGCLRLALGAGTATTSPPGDAHASTLSELSPRMDELFLVALRAATT